MKKLWVTILLLIYFTVSTGFVVNLHYCMGDLAGMELGHSEAEDCGKCGMPVQKKGGCCQDEVKIIKVAQDQSAATFAQFHFGIAHALPVPVHYADVPLRLLAHYGATPAHAPPLFSGQDIYLYNCVFRI